MVQSLFVEGDNPVDFFYLDRQRVSSLIGQLSDRGVLTGLKSGVANTRTTEGTADLGVPLLAKTEGKHSRTSVESQEETYDPFWTHVYSFLLDLETSFAVPLGKARLGSLVKFSALIQFVDLRIMRNLWEPAGKIFLQSQKRAQATATQASRQQRRAERRQQPRLQSQVSEAIELGLEIMKEVPHLLHMTFISRWEDTIFKLWGAVQPEYLTISSQDLVMKYGAVLDGLWTVVGVVDARIGPPTKPWQLNPVLDGVATAMAGLREFIGRPQDHWGITPIAIYAPLQGAAEAEIECNGPAPA